MVKRITYRRRTSYNTNRNTIRKVKTPGNKLVAQYQKKHAKGPHCKETKKRLSGIPSLRPKEYSRISKRDRSVSRAYGGTLDHSVVRDRIVRAFLTEEVKVLKRRLKPQRSA